MNVEKQNEMKGIYERVKDPLMVLKWGYKTHEFGADLVWYEETAELPGIGKVVIGSMIEVSPDKIRTLFVLLTKNQALAVKRSHVKVRILRRQNKESGKVVYVAFPTEEQFLNIAGIDEAVSGR